MKLGLVIDLDTCVGCHVYFVAEAGMHASACFRVRAQVPLRSRCRAGGQ